MRVHSLSYRETGFYSKLICDYLDDKEALRALYVNYPNIKGFKSQIKMRSTFDPENRKILCQELQRQYEGFSMSEETAQSIEALENEKTFTVTTGHQLNLFTGPVYFIYKIVTTISLAQRLKADFPDCDFVPVYWMASEDHDFEEISFFKYKGEKLSWDRDCSGGVGRLDTTGLDAVLSRFSELLGSSVNASYLKGLFTSAYNEKHSLADATRFLVNTLFKSHGLVIVDGDSKVLKRQFIPTMKEELLDQISFKKVAETNELIGLNYKVQVNPREINLFYLRDKLRERIVKKGSQYEVLNTNYRFDSGSLVQELESNPERFSPNVIMRPVYQETVLPNLCYVGGGGELAYWLQLRSYFDHLSVPMPIVLLRNSVLVISPKELKKLEKLDISYVDLFTERRVLVNTKVKSVSEISIDLGPQRDHLKDQFAKLRELAMKTDPSFLGAVLAQEKKQLNGLDKLEKRLLKAQRRKMAELVGRIEKIHQDLFPDESLQERVINFSVLYKELGDRMIPILLEDLDPLLNKFSVLSYE